MNESLESLKKKKIQIEANLSCQNNAAKELRKQLQKIERSIAILKKSKEDLMITDHAIVRYLERACGIDIKSIQSKINEEIREKAVAVGGSGRFPIENLGTAVVDNFKVITILPL